MKALPCGVESFKNMIYGDQKTVSYYYVDKTEMIREIISRAAKVNLIPRPRRFGKTLNLDMIRQFLDINGEPDLFDGLRISEDREICENYQGQYPILYFNFKGIEGDSFAQACQMFSEQLATAMSETYAFLKTSPHLEEEERENCRLYSDSDRWTNEKGNPSKSLTEVELGVCLSNLSKYLCKHYHHPVVVLIDEYDVPLNNAWVSESHDEGFYDKMEKLIRTVYGGLMKTNDALAFAVITGCMRIARESIFTGMNNLHVWSYTDNFRQDYFGFTESELRAMLDYYGIPQIYDTVKKWFDGFCFGLEPLYCPWDVIEYVSKCVAKNPPGKAKIELYWSSTSGNSILTDLLETSGPDVQENYLKLINGDSIEATLLHEMTFRDLEDKENLWSFMVASGYLKVVSEDSEESSENIEEWEEETVSGGIAVLAVPNLEVRKLLETHLHQWIIRTSGTNETVLRRFCNAFPRGDVRTVQTLLADILTGMLHQHDQQQKAAQRESLYHGIILGLLYRSWNVKSNIESGEGYCDVCLRTDRKTGVVIEMKDAGTGDLEEKAEDALQQIRDTGYSRELLNRGCQKILQYGIACKYHSVAVRMDVLSC